MREHTLALVGVQNAEPAQLAAAAEAGLASFAPSRSPVGPPSRAAGGRRRARARHAASAACGASRDNAGALGDADLCSRHRSHRDRIGEPGAELVADGNIHVYGPLRGRALAGASGDTAARIFCSRLEAELVSIAGHYLVSDQLPPEQRGFSVADRACR